MPVSPRMAGRVYPSRARIRKARRRGRVKGFRRPSPLKHGAQKSHRDGADTSTRHSSKEVRTASYARRFPKGTKGGPRRGEVRRMC